MSCQEEQIAKFVASIRGYRAKLDDVSKPLRTPKQLACFDKLNHESWCLSATSECLVRLRLFTEQNFRFVETIGAIAVARYIFEVSVWLHLFKLDPRYGLVYYHQLLDTQRRYWRDYRDQLRREIGMLKEFGQAEEEARREVLNRIKGTGNPKKQGDALRRALEEVTREIDERASRRFSVYAEQAKKNGYEFQAHLVEANALPRTEESLADIEAEIAAFNERAPQGVQDLLPKRWQWRDMARRVNLVDEYDFIYSFASKLLHATPASLTTNQKNLEPEELALFLKYINVKIADIIALARQYPRE